LPDRNSGVQATPDRFDSSARPSRLLRSLAVALLATLAVVVGAPAHRAAPAAQASNGLKAVVIVGPSGDSTSLFLDIGAKIAGQAETAGFDVRRVFHPRATTARVLEHLPGANLVVYLGHGNGWPSPYAPFQEKTKNGFGLNEVEGGSPYKHVYRGASWIRSHITLAPNAVALLVGACYASGNGEPGMPIPSQDVAKQRVDNFASGFLAVGAGAVFAFGWEQRANIPNLLATSNKTVDEIFMTRSNGSPSGWVGWNDRYFDSDRTPGAKVHLDPHHSYGYYRALTGNMSMTAAQFRGQSGDAGGTEEPGTPLPEPDPDQPVGPSAPDGLAAESLGRRYVKLTWQASESSRPLRKYVIFRNGTRIGSTTQLTFTDRPGRQGTFTYKVRAVDVDGNRSPFTPDVEGVAVRYVD
jgi:hypothetical protein